MDNFDVYKDIQARTNGEIYIGVVGPVRTGKSTFIKRFMDLLVIPNIVDTHSKERAIDELPQSATGKTIMTTEPKFIPKEAANIKISDDTEVNIRLIDCVGYMVDGAQGHIENDHERLVKTPWYDYEIPFTQAAEIGTKKVINDHSTIGIVVTTDGSFGELGRENYMKPEERTFVAIKPDAVNRGLIGEIIARFEKRGFKIIGMKLLHPTLEHAQKHYAEHFRGSYENAKGFYKELENYRTNYN